MRVTDSIESSQVHFLNTERFHRPSQQLRKLTEVKEEEEKQPFRNIKKKLEKELIKVQKQQTWKHKTVIKTSNMVQRKSAAKPALKEYNEASKMLPKHSKITSKTSREYKNEYANHSLLYSEVDGHNISYNVSDKKSHALPANSNTLDSIEEKDFSNLVEFKDLKMNKMAQLRQIGAIKSHIENNYTYDESEFKLNRSHRFSMTATEIKDSYNKPDDSGSREKAGKSYGL